MSRSDFSSPDASGKSPGSPVSAHFPPLSASETVCEMSSAIQSLEDYGLRLGDPSTMTAEAVEQVLITDEWSCDRCGRTKLPVCPETSKPHRRRLVRIAQDLLRLVGRCVGKSYARPAPLAERIDGKVRVRTARHIAVNPQLLLLAFYFAAPAADPTAPAEPQSPSFVVECARHLLDLLQQVESYGRRVSSEMDEQYAKTLLKSFYSAWKEYLKHASGEMASCKKQSEERVSADELFNGTRNALVAAARESARDPANTDLQAFAVLLYQRIKRLATKEQLSAVNDEMRCIEEQSPTLSPLLPDVVGAASPAPAAAPDLSEAGETSPTARSAAAEAGDDTPTRSTAVRIRDETPKIEHANPLLMPSDLNTTSGSEADALTHAAAASALGFTDGRPQLGPELPPDWYVDETGRSRPKPGHEERKKREKYLQLEFRARKAYEAVMNVEPPKTEAELTREAMTTAVGEAQLEELTKQLNQAKPRFTLIPQLLRLVEESLKEALPRRFRPQLEQEFRDALDWNVIVRRSANGQAALSSVLQFMMHKVIHFGAPEREDAIRADTARVSKDLDMLTPDLGTAVANAFRFLFSSVKTLREDVAKYSLLLLSNQLRTNALEYIRAFVDTCLPRPESWSSSISFLKQNVNCVSVREWMTSQQSEALVLLSKDERRVRGALLFGLVELLRSGKHSPTDRWDQLPAEIFYFEKSYIFSAANTVQECTLLLLLEGTVSSILASKRCTHAQVAETLKRLHHHILNLLSQDIKLNALKVAVTDFLDNALETLGAAAKSAGGSAALPPPPSLASTVLTAAERRVVDATIEKMTNTESPLYVSFESKVVQFMSCVMTSDATPAPLGLVTESATKQAKTLSKMLSFNWEAYRPFYQTLIPSLCIEE